MCKMFRRYAPDARNGENQTENDSETRFPLNPKPYSCTEARIASNVIPFPSLYIDMYMQNRYSKAQNCRPRIVWGASKVQGYI